MGPSGKSVPECLGDGAKIGLLISQRKDCALEYTKKKGETESINSPQPIDCAGLSDSAVLPAGVFKTVTI